MKPLRVLVPVAMVLLVLLGIAQLTRRSGAAEAAIERATLRREFVERAGVARGLAGPAGTEEAKALLAWWFDGLAAIAKRHPSAPASATLGSDSRRDRDAARGAEWQRYTGEWLTLLRGYAPVLSGVDQGVRLDLVRVQVGEAPETRERALRFDFALWGAPRRIDPDPGSPAGDRAPLRVTVPVSFRQLAFHFTTADKKPFGEMSGGGEPYAVLRDPERFSPDLPPNVLLGTWWVEPFPREAARVEIAVSASVQGMAGALGPAYRWELPIPENWKLRPGETFKAEERTAAPDDAQAK